MYAKYEFGRNVWMHLAGSGATMRRLFVPSPGSHLALQGAGLHTARDRRRCDMLGTCLLHPAPEIVGTNKAKSTLRNAAGVAADRCSVEGASQEA